MAHRSKSGKTQTIGRQASTTWPPSRPQQYILLLFDRASKPMRGLEVWMNAAHTGAIGRGCSATNEKVAATVGREFLSIRAPPIVPIHHCDIDSTPADWNSCQCWLAWLLALY